MNRILIILCPSMLHLHASTLVTSILNSVGDVTLYTDNAGALSVEDASNAVDPYLSNTTLQGTASSAGSNLELGRSLDNYTDMSATGAFANAATTILTTTHSTGDTVTVRGLNGADWFTTGAGLYDTSYGADNLANQYFNDLYTAGYNAANLFGKLAITQMDATSLYEQFRDAGGFAQVSDPNISYVTVENGQATVGLAGFVDTTPRLAQLTGYTEDTLNGLLTNGFQSSEVAMINGEAVYSFSGVSSGTVLDDGVDSYAATYEVALPIPEPSSALLALLGTLTLLRRSR